MPAPAWETVELEARERVAWITLNRPDAMNAVTPESGSELAAAVEWAAADRDIRVLVITGAGHGFCSGADLKSPSWRREDGGTDLLGPLRDLLHPLILRLRTLEKPVISAVNGGASVLLLERVGRARAGEMALLAERVPAAQALAWGMANRVAPDSELLAVTADLAGRLAAGSPGSHAAIKRSLGAAAHARLEEILELEATLQQERADSDDFLEGVQAFREKRPPQFTGGR